MERKVNSKQTSLCLNSDLARLRLESFVIALLSLQYDTGKLIYWKISDLLYKSTGFQN